MVVPLVFGLALSTRLESSGIVCVLLRQEPPISPRLTAPSSQELRRCPFAARRIVRAGEVRSRFAVGSYVQHHSHFPFRAASKSFLPVRPNCHAIVSFSSCSLEKEHRTSRLYSRSNNSGVSTKFDPHCAGPISACYIGKPQGPRGTRAATKNVGHSWLVVSVCVHFVGVQCAQTKPLVRLGNFRP